MDEQNSHLKMLAVNTEHWVLMAPLKQGKGGPIGVIIAIVAGWRMAKKYNEKCLMVLI